MANLFAGNIQIKLSKDDVEAALAEYIGKRTAYGASALKVLSMEMHKAGGHAITVILGPETKQEETTDGDQAE